MARDALWRSTNRNRSFLARSVRLKLVAGALITLLFVCAEPALLFLAAFDDHDTLLASYNPDGLELGLEMLTARLATSMSRGVLVLDVPMTYQDVDFGTLFVGISLAEMEQRIAADRLTAGLFCLMVLLVGGGLSVAVADRVVRPLEELTRAARKVAAGEMDVELIRRSSDEVGDLTEAFVTMVGQLRSSIDDLAKSRDVLASRSENLVSARDVAQRAVKARASSWP